MNALYLLQGGPGRMPERIKCTGIMRADLTMVAHGPDSPFLLHKLELKYAGTMNFGVPAAERGAQHPINSATTSAFCRPTKSHLVGAMAPHLLLFLNNSMLHYPWDFKLLGEELCASVCYGASSSRSEIQVLSKGSRDRTRFVGMKCAQRHAEWDRQEELIQDLTLILLTVMY